MTLSIRACVPFGRVFSDSSSFSSSFICTEFTHRRQSCAYACVCLLTIQHRRISISSLAHFSFLSFRIIAPVIPVLRIHRLNGKNRTHVFYSVCVRIVRFIVSRHRKQFVLKSTTNLCTVISPPFVSPQSSSMFDRYGPRAPSFSHTLSLFYYTLLFFSFGF